MFTLSRSKAVTLNATARWKKIAISALSATMNAMMMFGVMAVLLADRLLLGKM
jgi:hypothetical protein